jgi:archaellum biogenesis protein FlaJ (TadC family)
MPWGVPDGFHWADKEQEAGGCNMTGKLTEYVRMLLISCDFEYDPDKFVMKMLAYGLGLGLAVGLIFFNYSLVISAAAAFIFLFGFEFAIFGMMIMAANKRIEMIESALPDFLSMMASNIRSGLTYDRALLLSARKEFGPLAKEIDLAAKETLTGKPLSEAFMDITKRTNSEVLAKTIRLIVEGINSGGNLADLLETTSLDIRRFGAIRKEVAATVLIYQLFMLAAAAVGAPIIYAVTTFLVGVITSTKAKITATATEGASYLPFFKTGASTLTPDMIFWFSLAALLLTSFFGALAIGVISKGKESEGIPYFPLMLFVSYGIFFGTKFALEFFAKGMLSM